MTMWTIYLAQVAPIAASHEVKKYDPALDSITSVLSDVCDSLSDEGSVAFLVGGFGQDRWPVDVRTDLPVVVEQLPAALDALRRGAVSTLGFYEQGIQRVLTMTPSGSKTIVECQSMTSWQPEPSTIRMDTVELVQMISALLDAFVDLCSHRYPGLVEHPWFREWLGRESASAP